MGPILNVVGQSATLVQGFKELGERWSHLKQDHQALKSHTYEQVGRQRQDEAFQAVVDLSKRQARTEGEMKIQIREALKAQGAQASQIDTILQSPDVQKMIQSSVVFQEQKRALGIQIKAINGKPLRQTLSPSHVWESGLTLMTEAAVSLDHLAKEHPTLVGYSLTAFQVALSGPAGFVRDYALEKSGVQGQMDTLIQKAEGWIENRLQKDLGWSEGGAKVLTAGGSFGCMVGLSTLGGSGKDKILGKAKDVSDKTKVYISYLKPHPKAGGKPYYGRTQGVEDVSDPFSMDRIVRQRDRNHHMNQDGFRRAEIDKVSTNRDAIRGQE